MFSRFEIQSYIFFLNKSVGGRHNFASGLGNYQPIIRIADDYLTSTIVRCKTTERMETENYYDVKIELPIWREVEDYLNISLKERFKTGAQVHLHEGTRIVAIGMVKHSEYY